METLVLPFVPANADFRPESLMDCQDEVTFTVFDVVDNEDEVEAADHQYLGALSLPLRTIYLSEKVHGSLPLDIPLGHLGYERSTERPTLSIFATLDPLCPVPNNNQVRLRYCLVVHLKNLSTERVRPLGGYSEDIGFKQI